jgi:hypothetical protein
MPGLAGQLHFFSADSLESLQTFSDRVKSRQTTIEIVHDAHTGYILRDPDTELAAQNSMTPQPTATYNIDNYDTRARARARAHTL